MTGVRIIITRAPNFSASRHKLISRWHPKELCRSSGTHSVISQGVERLWHESHSHCSPRDNNPHFLILKSWLQEKTAQTQPCLNVEQQGVDDPAIYSCLCGLEKTIKWWMCWTDPLRNNLLYPQQNGSSWVDSPRESCTKNLRYHGAYWWKQNYREKLILERLEVGSVAHFSGSWFFFLETSNNKIEWNKKCVHYFSSLTQVLTQIWMQMLFLPLELLYIPSSPLWRLAQVFQMPQKCFTADMSLPLFF